MADLKKVYAAIDEQTALSELENFENKWGNKLLKMLYLAMVDITKKWTGKRRE